MAKYIAFLRAVNVGGRNVRMDEICGLFESAGASNAERFLASGNIIFDTRSRSRAGLTKKIEKTLDEALGYEVDVFLRTMPEVAAIAEHRAFKPKAVDAAEALNVGLLAEPLTPAQHKRLLELTSDAEKGSGVFSATTVGKTRSEAKKDSRPLFCPARIRRIPTRRGLSSGG